jgi:integrase
MRKSKQEFKLFKNVWISTKPVLPGVWERKEGGHVVRARVTDPATGKTREIFRVLPEATATSALQWVDEERAKVRAGNVSVESPCVRFNAFATSLFKEKVETGDIRSAAGRNKWLYTMPHLFKAFGDYFIDKIHVAHVEAWRSVMAKSVTAGNYSPATVNSWLNILRVIMKAARRKYQLSHDAVDGVRLLDTSEHATYSDEEPNALLPDEVADFIAKFRERYPQHFAMLFVMLITGLRPSSVRPLRRSGQESDVDWKLNRLRVRRSHTQGEEVMRTTKQKRRYVIDLPEEAMTVLKWHVKTQLETPEQRGSDLLFPSLTGSFRTQKVLNHPMAEVAAELGITKKLTQRALRRTFNDLARAAQVNDLVTRSISGHLTEKMQAHYSTVNGGEQREALAKVIRLTDHRGPSLVSRVREEGRARSTSRSQASGEQVPAAVQGGEHSGEHRLQVGSMGS